MEPTLQVGERFFVNRAVYKVSSPERGDIIVYKTSGSDDAALHIGRVIGLPGETVQISNGAVLINGEVYNENKNFLKSVMRDWHPTECLWKAVSILYLAITEITVRTAGMVISEISIRNILWERYGLSFPRKINLDF